MHFCGVERIICNHEVDDENGLMIDTFQIPNHEGIHKDISLVTQKNTFIGSSLYYLLGDSRSGSHSFCANGKQRG